MHDLPPSSTRPDGSPDDTFDRPAAMPRETPRGDSRVQSGKPTTPRTDGPEIMNPDSGLGSRESDALGPDAYRDPTIDRPHDDRRSHTLGSTPEEGGALTKDDEAHDIPLGSGNRKKNTSGATTGH